ncbi:MAG: VWA domain-containing protein, partial [Deltaproteobacteria bacterium]|nr:VWA domain-containing protein [Deltaproteobacteria bacterium]
LITMRWANPKFFLLLFLLLGLALLFVNQSSWRKKVWKQLGETRLFSHFARWEKTSSRRLRRAFAVLALFFLILALAEPQWGSREVEVSMKGVHLIILLDVSDSMLAEDLKPNRFERQRQELQDLLGELKGDRVGLVAFAGRSFLLSPLTVDYPSLKRYVDELSTDTIPIQGTDLAGALNLAMGLFPKSEADKAILLMSDGEDHSEKLKKVLEQLKEQKIRLFVLGIGTPEGAPVPDPQGGFKRDRNGKRVLSQLKEDFLKDLALKTGGVYARSVSSEADLESLYIQGIRRGLKPTEFQVSKQKIMESRFYYPLALALLFLFLERLLKSI